MKSYGTHLRAILQENLKISIIDMSLKSTDLISDNIGSKLLKLDPLSFCYPLRKIFNKSIEMGKYPDGMKLAKVVPIFKKGPMYISDNL